MNSHLTAIKRSKMSVPCRYLKENELLIGDVLDFGCGRGFDFKELAVDGYDPHYFPEGVEKDTYDTIYCIYVLNVIPDRQRRFDCLVRMKNLLNPGGNMYITVRNDRNNLKGYTKRGTFQCYVTLDTPIVQQTATYTTYVIHKDGVCGD